MNPTQAGPAAMTGGCQCGKVRYALATEPRRVSICHCRMCQKAVGGYFGAFAGVKLAELAWTRGAPSVFASSEVAERGFCRDCGTPLTFRYVESDRISVTTGSLDEPHRLRPTLAHGIEGKAPWFEELATLPASRTEDDVPAVELARYRSRQHPDHEI